MTPRIRHLALDDAAPYRRLAQFAPQAQIASAPRVPVTTARRILGLPARIPLLTTAPFRRVVSPDARLDAA